VIDDVLPKVAALKRAGRHEEAYAEAVSLARAFPSDVRAQTAAAYAADRLGREEEAVAFYERAHELGPLEDDQPGFLLGYGSTLRSIGRLEQAVAVLRNATIQYPSETALFAFLALALHSHGQHREAMAMMLDVALKVTREDGLGGYDRALREYQEELSTLSGSEDSGTSEPNRGREENSLG